MIIIESNCLASFLFSVIRACYNTQVLNDRFIGAGRSFGKAMTHDTLHLLILCQDGNIRTNTFYPVIWLHWFYIIPAARQLESTPNKNFSTYPTYFIP